MTDIFYYEMHKKNMTSNETVTVPSEKYGNINRNRIVDGHLVPDDTFVQYVNVFYGNHAHVHLVNIYSVKNVFRCELKIQINVHFVVDRLKNVDVHLMFNHYYLV